MKSRSPPAGSTSSACSPLPENADEAARQQSAATFQEMKVVADGLR
jgi:hypothetical protein